MVVRSNEEKGTLEACYDELRDEWFSAVVKPPQLDYLTLALCCSHDDYKPVVDALENLRFEHHRFVFKNRALYRDGVKVGHIRLSQGSSVKFGRKILFHFTGEFFRGGCDEGLAWFFRNKFEESIWALSDYIENPDWIAFTEVWRLDIAIELKKAHRELTPTMIRVDGPTLPGDLKWREHLSSHEGITDYASRAHKGLASRAKHPLVRLYTKHDVEPNSTRWSHSDTMRLEIEFPAVQRVDGTDKMREYVRLATQLFNTLTPFQFVAAYDAREHREEIEFGEAYIVPAPDWTEQRRPEDFTAHPWTGHPAREVSRLFKCGAAITYTALSTMLMVNLMHDAGSRGGMFSDDDKQPSFSFHESVTDEQRREALAMIPNPGYTIDDLQEIQPPTMEELDRLELMLFATRRYFYPESVPAVIDRHKRASASWVKDPQKWVEKFLTPVTYPERLDTPWEMAVDWNGRKYLEHKDTGEKYYPGETGYEHIANVAGYNMRKRASRFYELDQAELPEWTETPAAVVKKAEIDNAALNLHRIAQGEEPMFMNAKDRLKLSGRDQITPYTPQHNLKFEDTPEVGDVRSKACAITRRMSCKGLAEQLGACGADDARWLGEDCEPTGQS